MLKEEKREKIEESRVERELASPAAAGPLTRLMMKGERQYSKKRTGFRRAARAGATGLRTRRVLVLT